MEAIDKIDDFIHNNIDTEYWEFAKQLPEYLTIKCQTRWVWNEKSRLLDRNERLHTYHTNINIENICREIDRRCSIKIFNDFNKQKRTEELTRALKKCGIHMGKDNLKRVKKYVKYIYGKTQKGLEETVDIISKWVYWYRDITVDKKVRKKEVTRFYGRNGFHIRTLLFLYVEGGMELVNKYRTARFKTILSDFSDICDIMEERQFFYINTDCSNIYYAIIKDRLNADNNTLFTLSLK